MGKSAPSAPDPVATAQAQTQSNEQTAQYQQQLNMIDSSGPNGSVNYTPSGAPGGYTQTTTLSPAQQGIYNSETGAEQGALGLANTQLGRVGTALGTSVDPSSYGSLTSSVSGSMGDPAVQNAANAAYGTATQYLTPQLQQEQESLQSSLAAQGLNPNDAAYGNAMTLFNNQENQAYQGAANAAVTAGDTEQSNLFGQALSNAQLGNTAQQQGFNEGSYAQELPINEFDALLGSGQVSMPTGVGYTASSVQPTNVAGIDQASYEDQLQNYNLTNPFGALYQLGAVGTI